MGEHDVMARSACTNSWDDSIMIVGRLQLIHREVSCKIIAYHPSYVQLLE